MEISHRLKAAAMKHRSSKSIVQELSNMLNRALDKKREAEEEIRWSSGFIEFQGREAREEYQGPFRVFQIEDGETHMIAAVSPELALQFYMELGGYASPEDYRQDVGDVEVSEISGETTIPVYDIDDTGKLIVKTAAEWADVDEPCFVSTTVY